MLNKSGVISVQRTCFACKFYDDRNDGNFCLLLEKELSVEEIKLDCGEFEEKK